MKLCCSALSLLLLVFAVSGCGSAASSASSASQSSIPVITYTYQSSINFDTYLITVGGTGFATGATLMVNGSAVATTAVKSNLLQTTVSNTSGSTMQISVAVQNPPPSSAVSSPTSFTLSSVTLPTTQQQWMSDVSQQNTSPVTAVSGDAQLSWTAPDTRTINVVVKAPAPAAGAPTVTMGSVPTGADARPYFDAALSLAASEHAGLLAIPTGTYTFKSLGTGSLGHLQILGQSDLVIDGQGSTLIFTQNANGVVIDTSQRVELTNFTIQYSLPTQMYWIGTMSSTTPYTITPIAGYTVTSADTIGHMVQYNPATSSFVHGNVAVYSPASLAFTGTGFTSSSFNSSDAGKTFMVFDHYYGGVAINIETYNAPSQMQDITLNNITINSGPGMAIFAYGVQRGLGIWNSHILPAAGSLISTEYDAINIPYVGGDIYIHDNVIGYEGDDALNLNNLMLPVVSTSGTSLVLGQYSRFVQQNDLLSFFDASNTFLGMAQVTAPPVALGGLNWSFTLSNSVSGVTTSSIVRDMNLVNSRTAVVNNTIENCQCHGMLIQDPNVLVQGNTLNNTLADGIKLITNVGSFKEGTGAINVLVQNNTINTTGIDADIPNTSFYGGIYVYGGTNSGLTSTVSNQYINIQNNTISNTDQDCIVVASAQYVNVTSNQCVSNNLTTSGSPSIYILKSNNVTVSGNTRTGTSTGAISVDSTTTSNITVQSTY